MPNRSQQARIARELHVRKTADYFTAMVYRLGHVSQIATLEGAIDTARALAMSAANLQQRPAMVYACTNTYMNNVLVGTVDHKGNWREANG